IALALLVTSAFVTFCGLINARIIRLRRVTVALPNLPVAWRGRRAVLLSDLHLGNINRRGFAKRVADRVRALDPEIIFLPGDLFDGTRVSPEIIAGPILDLHPPLGLHFVTGNHEVYGGIDHFTAPLDARGVSVLDNVRVDVDGVTILGISYKDSTSPIRVQQFLSGQRLDATRPSILLQHVPNRLPIVEQCGVSLQLSGHTHGGQFLPFTFITRRAFGKFTHGLNRLGNLQVYTSSGVGTWGPPLRIGSASEIVLLTFA
ncbi:MAG TPA: metallophosphoesterase, partial [Terracidiphilus sp.]|nr:metallophosphoesterase [Terracidiphilus sp.]